MTVLEDLTAALLVFVALYPIASAAYWIAGGVVFAVLEERRPAPSEPADWPPVSILIPRTTRRR
jgi:hypothetical protein